MPRRERQGELGTRFGVIDDYKKTREFGGFAARLASEHLGTIAILEQFGWSDPAAVPTAAERLLQHALEKRLNRICHPTALVGDLRVMAAEFLRQVMFAVEPQKGRVNRLRRDAVAPFGVKLGTLRVYEDAILFEAADDVMRLAQDWRAVELSSPVEGHLPSTSPFHTAAGDAWSSSLVQLLDASDVMIADYLYRGARLPLGFDAQEFGRGELSRASSATVVYAFAALPWVDDTTIQPLYDELCGWVQPNGRLAGRYEDSGASETTWANTLALYALTKRERLVRGRLEPSRLADRVLREQDAGGWKLRDSSNDPRPLFTLYPVLALRRASDAGWISQSRWHSARREALRFITEWLENCDEHRPLEVIVALRALQVAQATAGTAIPRRFSSLISEVGGAVTARGFAAHYSETVTEDHVPLWHANINIPALYLASRHIWPTAHPVNLTLGRLLVDSFDHNEFGWTNAREPSARPYSWTTAWGILATRALARDIRREWQTTDRWLAAVTLHDEPRPTERRVRKTTRSTGTDA